MSATAQSRVRREESEGVLALILARPEKRNALDAETISELAAALAGAEDDASVRVLLLRGDGADFCAGADLAALERLASRAEPLDNLRDASALGDLFVRMRRLPKPIVAAVHGHALAGGAGLAGACDLVLAAEDAVFGYPEVHLGFVPAMVMTLLRRSVGEKAAFELVSRGERIDAREAHRLGLVNRVVPAATLHEAAWSYARELAERSSSALALSKRLLYGLDGLPFEEGIRRGAEVNALARLSEDTREGVRRFLEGKRGGEP